MTTIENQADLETTKYVTRDFAEKLIRKKVEGAMNVLLSDLEGKLEEGTDKLFNEHDKKITIKSDGALSNLQSEYKKQTEDLLNTIKNNELSKGVDTNKPVRVASGETGINLTEDDDSITRTKVERQQGFEDWYNKGLNELSRLNYSVAIMFFSNAINLNPKSHTAYHKRGDAYFSLKIYEKAISDFNKTIEMDPENFVACGRRGDAYGKLEQYGKAIEDYNKVIYRNPRYAPAYNNRGNTYYYIGQYEKAIKDYNNVIKLSPGKSYSYIQLSKVNIVTGNCEGALDIITKVLS